MFRAASTTTTSSSSRSSRWGHRQNGTPASTAPIISRTSHHSPRYGAVDGVGPHGHLLGVVTQERSTSSAAWCRTRSARARTGRWASSGNGAARQLPGRSSVSLAADRLNGRLERRIARRREGVVPHLLRRRQYGAGARGDIDVPTHARRRSASSPHSGRPGTHPPASGSRRAPKQRAVMYDQVSQTTVRSGTSRPSDGRRRPARDRGTSSAEARPPTTSARLSRAARGLGQRRPSAFEIAGIFSMTAAVKNGVEPARVEAAMQANCAASSPRAHEDEMERARRRCALIPQGLERIGGFGGKADVLAACEVYEATRLLRALARPAGQCHCRTGARGGRALASRGDFTIDVRPQPRYQNAARARWTARAGRGGRDLPALAFPTCSASR